MRRLALLRHATTDAVRSAGFPADADRIDATGRAHARAAAAVVARAGWARDGVLVSPALRAIETADVLDAGSPVVVPALREADFGTWSGRTLADLADSHPDAVAAWMADPDATPHGGESLFQVLGRVGMWLEEEARGEGRSLVVTHGGVVKAAVVHALGAPADAFWRVDCAPLHVTELHAHDGRWTVTSLNVPLGESA